MTISKRYEVLANGTSMGHFAAADEAAAIEAYAKDAGYKSYADLCAFLGESVDDKDADGRPTVRAVEEEEHFYFINANSISMLDREADITMIDGDIASTNFDAYPSQLQQHIDEFNLELLGNLVRSADLTVLDYTIEPETGKEVEEQDYDFRDVIAELVDSEVLLAAWDGGYREAKGGKDNALTPFAEACVSDNTLEDLARDNAARADAGDIENWKIAPETWARSLGQAYAILEAA